MARAGNILVLVGVSASGKSSLAKAAATREYTNTESGKPSYKVGVLNTGTIMHEIARKRNPGMDVDRMRYSFGFEESKKYQKLTAKKIARAAKEYDLLLLTTHSYNPTHYTADTVVVDGEGEHTYYIPGLSPKSIQPYAKRLKGIVNIAAPPEHIARRRMEDTSRKRDAISLERIEYEAGLERDCAIASSTVNAAFYTEISNPDGGLKNASEKLAGLVAFVLKD